MNTKEVGFNGFKMSGFVMLFMHLMVCVGVTSGIIYGENVWLIVSLASGGALFFSFFPLGFMTNEPNNARVMIFFGKYRGTLKDNGFFWVNPFYVKKRITLRARNLNPDSIKVNDKTGNPVMIGMVLVWKVIDTYKAIFEIDTSSINALTTSSSEVQVATGKTRMGQLMKSFEKFVTVQSDAALREVAGQYAYDNNEAQCEETTLRSGGELVNSHLERALNERLAMAGIEVVEARINYLAYAPEIAAVMLRRQQAAAIISAREKIVDGAVSMVQMALTKLAQEHIVELDEDKKAAMVSNLLVVLCADEAAHPVVNAGTLHQ